MADGSSPVSSARLLFLLRHKLVGEIDMCALLALPHTATHGDALLEGHPIGRSKTAFLKRRPQQQNIDAGIAAAGQAIDGKPQGAKLAGAGPRLHPWHDAAFQFGNDLVGDISVEIVSSECPWPSLSSSSAPEPREWGGRCLATEEAR